MNVAVSILLATLRVFDWVNVFDVIHIHKLLMIGLRKTLKKTLNLNYVYLKIFPIGHVKSREEYWLSRNVHTVQLQQWANYSPLATCSAPLGCNNDVYIKFVVN